MRDDKSVVLISILILTFILFTFAFCLCTFLPLNFTMKRFSLISILSFLFLTIVLNAADTLHVAPCDEVAVTIFGDQICLSQNEGKLLRYVDGKLQSVYSGQDYANKISLQSPVRPVLDGTGEIYVLDDATNTVFSWDRFLNIRTVTPLDKAILSPKDFTINSEHDWLIYDDFYGHILQIRPREGFPSNWGDRPVSGDIKLFSVDQLIIVYLEDKRLLRVCDENGTTLKEYPLPKNINVSKIFILNGKTFGLRSKDGVYIWKPEDTSLRYLSDLKDVVYLGRQKTSYILISQQGVVVTIP